MSENTPQNTDAVESRHRKFQLIMSWVVIVILVGFGVFAMFGLARVHTTAGNFWLCLIYEQFPTVVALPMAGLGALFVTLVLKISAGDLSFEIAGLKFKGAAAPIVFWVICFLSISTSIGLLWQTQPAESKPYCADIRLDASN
jgi:hypothetical protein